MMHGQKNIKLRIYLFIYMWVYLYSGRSQWLRGLRRGSAAACLLELRFRIPLGHVCLSLGSGVCCQVEISSSVLSLVQRSPTDGVPKCDREAPIMRRALWVVGLWGKKCVSYILC